MAAVAQAELISDDPRCEVSQGVMADVREFVQASREFHGLLTPGQACKILDVSSGQMSVWLRRGRLRSKVVLGVRMVSAGEVMALHKQRTQEGVRVGGRKAASLADVAAAAWEDIDPLG